jgi:aerobic-type carbon monoxide dehydrogenase small subunit (CoxS/CutS family)
VKLEVTLSVNGTPRVIDVEPRTTLLEAIRESLLLTGAKEACGVGECGSCMALVDDAPTPTCLVLAVDAAAAEVVTVEGLAVDGRLDPVQEAFVEAGALQCGYCTPGMVVTAKALLRDRPAAGPEEIRRALSGVLCRCGSYPKVLAALELLQERGAS